MYRFLLSALAVACLAACGTAEEPYDDTVVEYADAAPHAMVEVEVPQQKAVPSPSELFSQAYALEQNAEAMEAGKFDSNYATREDKRIKYFSLYLQALPGMPEAQKDLERSFKRLLDDLTKENFGDQKATNHDLTGYLVEAWDANSIPRSQLRPMLVQLRTSLLDLSRATGFNPNKRYSVTADRELFRCSGFGAESITIWELYKRTDPGSAQEKRWHLQSLDYAELESCESSGEVIADYDYWRTAYLGYKELGYHKDAEEFATRIARNKLAKYAAGQDNTMHWGEGYGNDDDLNEAKKWLASLPAAKRSELLRTAAMLANEHQHFLLAATLYDELGNKVDAARMKALS